MSIESEKNEEDIPEGMHPEQISVLIIILGFAAMVAGVIYTKDFQINSTYFFLGTIIVTIGTTFFLISIYARIYTIEHFPVPIPDTVLAMLRIEQPARQKPEMGAGTSSKGFSFGTKPIPNPGRKTGAHPKRVTTAGTKTTPGVGVDVLEEVGASVKPSPKITKPGPEAALKTKGTKPGPTPAPKSQTDAEKYMDILEEAEEDKEFQEYIDKLVEE